MFKYIIFIDIHSFLYRCIHVYYVKVNMYIFNLKIIVTNLYVYIINTM